jgi:hypothetical protein
MLNNPDVPLIDIEECIRGSWLPKEPDDDDPEWEKKADKAFEEFHYFARMAIEIIIEEILEVNEENFRKIYDYTRIADGKYSYSANNRLFSDFGDFLLPEKKRELIESAKTRFKYEKTDHWI